MFCDMPTEGPRAIVITKSLIIFVAVTIVIIAIAVTVFYSGFGKQIWEGVVYVFMNAIGGNGVLSGLLAKTVGRVGALLPF